MTRSVYAALLIQPYYTKPVDTIEDVLESKTKIVVPKVGGITAALLNIDPRESVRKLAQKMHLVEMIDGEYKQKVLDG